MRYAKNKSSVHAATAAFPMSAIPVGMALMATGATYLLPLFAANSEAVRNFSLVFSSIMLEALPFMLLGSMAGGVIEVFVSSERMESLLPRSDAAAALVAAALGILFPVCECAIVPVVRRLAGKGLPASAAVSYLLAGPIVNPVVGLSTAMAYNLSWFPVVVRLGFGYVIAATVAIVLSAAFKRTSPFVPGITAQKGGCECGRHERAGGSCGCGHAHGHGSGDARKCAHGRNPGGGIGGRMANVCNHALDDFMAIAPYLVAGAAIAAVAQTCLERRLVLEVSSSPFLSSAAMTLLAILLNLCSEADAFIAASFRGLVPFSAQMAFLVIGPMLDVKLLLMYRNLFKPGAILLLAVLVVAAVMLMAALLEVAGAAL